MTIPRTKVYEAIRTVTADKKITSDEWSTVVKPEAEKTAKEASLDARRIVRMLAEDSFEIEAKAASDVRNFLRSRGYDVPLRRPEGMTEAQYANEVIRSNVTERDLDFANIVRRAGRTEGRQTVAVLDSSFDTDHEALDTKWWTNGGEVAGDGMDNDGNGYADDVHGWDFAGQDSTIDPKTSWGGHGSHVAGISTRGTEQVNAMALQIAEPFDAERVAEAIDYGAANGATVMNMSFKVATAEAVDVIKAAMERHPDVLFVASAGNDGRDLNTYKAETYLKLNMLPNFAVVASAEYDGDRASYSNYGLPYATHAAVGSNVLSTVPDDKFSSMSGTSMASPNVAAVAAKLKLMDPALTPAQLKEMMAETSIKDDRWTDAVQPGGLVDARTAYRLAALTGLVRDGMNPDDAARQLLLSRADKERLLPLVEKYV